MSCIENVEKGRSSFDALYYSDLEQ